MPVQHIGSGGGTIAVEIEGEGPLVICAPGMGDFRDAYEPIATQLVARGYKVARMDNRGHGDSGLLFDGHKYGDEASADDFIAVAKVFSGGKPVVLAGASFTAASATIAAGKQPDMVAGIMLFGPFLRNPQGVMGAIAPYLMTPMFAKPWGPTMWQTYAKTLWPGLGPEKAAERAKKSRETLDRGFYWRAFQQTVKGCDHSVAAPWIPKVQAPVLVVMGDKDPDFPKPQEEAKWVASNFKEATQVTVEGAGHAPQYEKPEFVGPKVLQYLDKLKESGRFS